MSRRTLTLLLYIALLGFLTQGMLSRISHDTLHFELRGRVLHGVVCALNLLAVIQLNPRSLLRAVLAVSPITANAVALQLQIAIKLTSGDQLTISALAASVGALWLLLTKDRS